LSHASTEYFAALRVVVNYEGTFFLFSLFNIATNIRTRRPLTTCIHDGI